MKQMETNRISDSTNINSWNTKATDRKQASSQLHALAVLGETCKLSPPLFGIVLEPVLICY